MIATKFLDGQGLGNQLWAYAACCSIAEELGMPHRIINPEKFKGQTFLEINVGSQEVNFAEHNDWSAWSLLNEEMFFDFELKTISSDFDRRVLSLTANTIIQGLFQSEKYFFGDLSRLKRYVKLKKDFLNGSLVSEDSCIVYIRGGEYKRHNNLILPKSYWTNAMRNMTEVYGVTDFIAVSDDDRYVRSMFPKMHILPGRMEHDYAALYQAKFAIIANSSWGYFPAKTGVDKTCVIAPLYWARFGNKYARWASPSNLYEDWVWQDELGNVYSYEQCLPGMQDTIEGYREKYTVLADPTILMSPGLRKYIPPRLRQRVKHGLGQLFPKWMG